MSSSGLRGILGRRKKNRLKRLIERVLRRRLFSVRTQGLIDSSCFFFDGTSLKLIGVLIITLAHWKISGSKKFRARLNQQRRTLHRFHIPCASRGAHSVLNDSDCIRKARTRSGLVEDCAALQMHRSVQFPRQVVASLHNLILSFPSLGVIAPLMTVHCEVLVSSNVAKFSSMMHLCLLLRP